MSLAWLVNLNCDDEKELNSTNQKQKIQLLLNSESNNKILMKRIKKKEINQKIKIKNLQIKTKTKNTPLVDQKQQEKKNQEQRIIV